jgi:hypothetical protein
MQRFPCGSTPDRDGSYHTSCLAFTILCGVPLTDELSVRSYAGKYSVTRRTSCLSGSADHAGDPGNGQEPLLAGRAVARAARVSAVAFATRCAVAFQNEKTISMPTTPSSISPAASDDVIAFLTWRH